MLTQSEGNLYHQAKSPKLFALWANASSGATRISTFDDFVKTTGRDKTSLATTGASPVDGRFVLTSQFAGRASAAQPIPASIASVTSLRQGARLLGAQPNG